MPDNIAVTLTWSEVAMAGFVGAMRNVSALRRNYRPGNYAPKDDAWTLSIEGAAGEIAVAKHLGLYWTGTIGEIDRDDVGPYQVKANCSRRLDDLIIQPQNRIDRIYIGVLSFIPRMIITGWIDGVDGKVEQYLREGAPGRPPAYFVPRGVLHSLAELPRGLEAAE